MDEDPRSGMDKMQIAIFASSQHKQWALGPALPGHASSCGWGNGQIFTFHTNLSFSGNNSYPKARVLSPAGEQEFPESALVAG